VERWLPSFRWLLPSASRANKASGQERTEWHNLVAYARGAEILRDYVRKGAKLFIEGRLTTRSWDDQESGRKMYRTEVVVDDISLISGRDGSSAGKGRVGTQMPGAGENSENSADLGIWDRDIPF
jgi:single-strand DNA-binding protein